LRKKAGFDVKKNMKKRPKKLLCIKAAKYNGEEEGSDI